MALMKEVTTRSREQAGHLLSRKLMAYKNTNAIVLAVSYGGAPVAFWLANLLNLMFDVMPCRKIIHPGNSSKTIGAITVDDVYMHEDIENIPQDYVFHQIEILRNSLKQERLFFDSLKPHSSLRDKVVILVDDVLINSDVMVASLRDIRKQSPLKIVAAIPFVIAEAASNVAKETDDLIYLQKEYGAQCVRDLHMSFPNVSREDVKNLLKESQSTRNLN